MNKKNLRQEKGITLIALVITIIVMLILVAVTINMAVNGGLFGYAGNAVRHTNEAIEQEKTLGDIESGLTTDELIEKFTSTPDIHSWTREGDTFTCSHCNASYTMGEEVVYSPNIGKTETTVKGEKSGYLAKVNNNTIVASNKISGKMLLAETKPELIPPTLTDQTITRESLTWIVLGLDKNGTLLITTKEPTEGTLTLQGAKAYVNGPTIMNTVCKELYSSSTYGNARSINIDDINSALEWTDTRGMVFPVSGDEYKVNAGTKFGDVGTGKMAQADWDAIKDNNQTPEEGKALTDYEIDGYCYIVSEVANINNTRRKAIVGSHNTPYWLASRGVRVYANFGYASFGPGTVNGVYVDSYGGMFGSGGGERDDGFGLRPVVSLKSALPEKVDTSGGGGSLR